MELSSAPLGAALVMYQTIHNRHIHTCIYIGIVRILYPRRIDRIKAFQARLVLDFATGPAPWHAQ